MNTHKWQWVELRDRNPSDISWLLACETEERRAIGHHGYVSDAKCRRGFHMLASIKVSLLFASVSSHLDFFFAPFYFFSLLSPSPTKDTFSVPTIPFVHVSSGTFEQKPMGWGGGSEVSEIPELKCTTAAWVARNAKDFFLLGSQPRAIQKGIVGLSSTSIIIRGSKEITWPSDGGYGPASATLS